MDGFPKLVQVIDSQRTGMVAFFEDGMVATFDYAAWVWRPATAHISYEALFCATTSVSASEPDLTLSPDIAVED